MSGRPATPSFTAPSYTTRTWATDTNYGAGAQPWSSQPIKVEPPSPAGGFVPGQGAGAPYVNKLLSDAFTQDTNAKTALTTLKTEAQAHAARVLLWAGQSPALNWLRATSGIGTIRHAGYSKLDDAWYVCSDDADVRMSDDQGVSWSSNLVLSVTGGEDCTQVAIAADGKVVVSTKTNVVYTYDPATDTPTHTALSSTSHVGGAAALVVFEPISAKFVWMGINASNNLLARRASSPGTSWSAATTAPTGTWSGAAETAKAMAVNPVSGRVVYVAGTSSTVMKIATSDDGGANWTTQTDLTISISGGPLYVSLVYDTERAKWTCTLSNSSTASQVFESSDGITWTLIATLAKIQLRRMACLGGGLLIAAANISGTSFVSVAGIGIVYSTDGGTTWLVGGQRMSAAVGVFGDENSGGVVACCAASGVFVSARQGNPGKACT